MSEWRDVEIQSGLKKIIDYRGRTPPKSDSGIVLISAANIKDGQFDFSKQSFISHDDYKKWTTRGFTQPGDVLITTEAPVGEVTLLPGDQTYQISRRVMALRTDEKVLHNKFLCFALQNPMTKAELLASSRGSTVPRVLKTDITEFKISAPKYLEQKAIAQVLSSLDDKIDLLHRQNKTLEAIAETLFRQWFIEEAQDNWEDGTLEDVLGLSYGKALKQDTRTGFGFPVVGSSGVVGYHSDYLVNGPGVVIGRKGTLGKVIYLFESFFPIDTTYYIKPKAASSGLFYEYFLLKTLNFENSDSAVPGLNRDIALSEEIRIAPQSKVNSFSDYCVPIFKKLETNALQLRTLEKLRDTLLPKLMSGEVRVKSE
ncbi:MAG: restriction endonuclease subunit S [Phormidesmis sp.]